MTSPVTKHLLVTVGCACRWTQFEVSALSSMKSHTEAYFF